MAYSQILAKTYAKNRNKYRSSDCLLAPLLKKVGIKGKNILDLGCGDGSEAEMLIGMKAKTVIGADSSAGMIKLAKRKKLSNTVFIKTNGKTLSLKDNQFDLVYSRFVLHYIIDLKSQFAEIARVLKTGGYFLAIFQTVTNNPKLLNKRVPFTLGEGKTATKIVILSKSTNEVREAVKKSGMKILKFTEIHNTDAHIDPKSRDKYKFKNKTHILFAKKV